MQRLDVERRREQLLAEEAKQPETWWWLSFCDETGFLGGVMTRAPGFATALLKTCRLGINPGGDVRGFAFPEPPKEHEQYADQLLSAHDIEHKMGGIARMDGFRSPNESSQTH
jgi:hypothetical protein